MSDAGRLFQPLDEARGLVLAVSGGPDSTALMHLAAAWRGSRAVPVWVATVDHGLRPGSAAVAEQVLDAAAALGLPARALRWEGDKPSRAIQDEARRARYRLLTQFARDNQASHLVTAHTRDDQAETVLMRLAAGSGLSGLAGMRAKREFAGVTLVRPLLDVTKVELIALCHENGWAFSDDPANMERRFARARWRALAPQLEAEGLTAMRLARLATRAARADTALERIAEAAADRSRRDGPAGQVIFDSPALLAEPDEIVLRVLAQSLMAVGGEDRLRLHRLERLLDSIRQTFGRPAARRRTLAGCLIECGPDLLSIRREPPRRGQAAEVVQMPGFQSR